MILMIRGAMRTSEEVIFEIRLILNQKKTTFTTKCSKKSCSSEKFLKLSIDNKQSYVDGICRQCWDKKNFEQNKTFSNQGFKVSDSSETFLYQGTDDEGYYNYRH